MDDLLSSFHILIGWHSIFFNLINEVSGKLVALSCPLFLGLVELVHHGVCWVFSPARLRYFSNFIPAILREWSWKVILILINSRIPKGMKLVNICILFRVNFKHKFISTHVTLFMLRVISADRMKRLMHITNIMDQKPQIETISKSPGYTILIVIFWPRQSLMHISNRPSDVEFLREDYGVIAVEERLIDIMPWRLHTHTFVLEVVCES